MKTSALFLTMFVLVVLTGCSENPVIHDDGEEEAVTVAFQVSAEHMDTLEDVTFTAAVTTHHGDPVTDFEEVSMQYRHEDSSEWEDLVLALSGTDYIGTMMFTSSGDFEVRVMGRHHGHDHLETLHEVVEHLHVGRAHLDIGGFRVEYESFPGDLHEGDTAIIQYWVMEDTVLQAPVTGLQAEIHCENPDGTEASYVAVEIEAGVYTTSHTFEGDGEAHVSLHFPGAGAAEFEAEFHFPISHGH